MLPSRAEARGAATSMAANAATRRPEKLGASPDVGGKTRNGDAALMSLSTLASTMVHQIHMDPWCIGKMNSNDTKSAWQN